LDVNDSARILAREVEGGEDAVFGKWGMQVH
jgi:hypothetical protein